VGGLLFIPSINLEPGMDASAKVRIALTSGFVLLILLAHSRRESQGWTPYQKYLHQFLRTLMKYANDKISQRIK
jgi:hypothetical protein